MAVWEAGVVNAACDAIVDQLNGGFIVAETSGDVEVWKATFGNPAFGDAAAGVATANAITKDSDAAGGTIDHVMITTSVPADIATCTIGTGGTDDFTIGNLTITAGDEVNVTSLTVTVADGS